MTSQIQLCAQIKSVIITANSTIMGLCLEFHRSVFSLYMLAYARVHVAKPSTVLLCSVIPSC